MIINTYTTEQVARFHRQEREAAAGARLLAREARSSRWQRTAPSARPVDEASSTVRIPRQRRWLEAVVTNVR